MSEPELRIRRLVARCRVPAGTSAERRLSVALADQLAGPLERALSAAGLDGFWVLRRVDVRAGVGTGWTTAQMADAVARGIGAGVRRAGAARPRHRGRAVVPGPGGVPRRLPARPGPRPGRRPLGVRRVRAARGLVRRRVPARRRRPGRTDGGAAPAEPGRARRARRPGRGGPVPRRARRVQAPGRDHRAGCAARAARQRGPGRERLHRAAAGGDRRPARRRSA